jgi:hypothetical protein
LLRGSLGVWGTGLGPSLRWGAIPININYENSGRLGDDGILTTQFNTNPGFSSFIHFHMAFSVSLFMAE